MFDNYSFKNVHAFVCIWLKLFESFISASVVGFL